MDFVAAGGISVSQTRLVLDYYQFAIELIVFLLVINVKYYSHTGARPDGIVIKIARVDI